MFARKSKVSPHAAEDSDQTDHTDTTPVAAPEQSATLDQHSNTRPAQGMPLQSSQSQSNFHWIITSTLFSSWWPWTFLGDREMTRARRLRERSRVSKKQNRVRLIERRGAHLHSISDKKVNPDGYHSYGTRGMRYHSLPHVSRRTGLHNLSLRLD